MISIFDLQLKRIRPSPRLLIMTTVENLPKTSYVSNYPVFIQTLTNKCTIE
jgi:hypothetical protein